jgi:hypothetical protein
MERDAAGGAGIHGDVHYGARVMTIEAGQENAPIGWPRPAVERLPAYRPGKDAAQAEAEHGITNAIKLASNENPLPTIQAIVDAVTAAACGANRYADHRATAVRSTRRCSRSPSTRWPRPLRGRRSTTMRRSPPASPTSSPSAPAWSPPYAPPGGGCPTSRRTSSTCRSASAPTTCTSIERRGVVTRPFGGEGIRVTISTPADNDRFLATLADVTSPPAR